ncbi:cir1 protein-related [Plasmodium yoelii yoelii]|uniref:Cir1 protein-related n=1 Tax=Plasmodium yoelii yoelii TaxID=73239 RepID=Q7R9R4_PLAYO|nr:cir1 protein-related [Plasmodium yoelii yoelii]
MDNNIISNFYKAFKSLHEMYFTFGESTSNCKKCSKNVNQFVEKYKELNGDSNNTDNSPYRKILSTLSTDYNKLKDKCKDAKDSNFPPIPEIKTTQSSVVSSEDNSAQKSEHTVQNSDVIASNSSIVTKLIPVLSIFGAISIFLGVSYKVNNKEFINYFHYIYPNVNKKNNSFTIFILVFVIWISETIAKTTFKRKAKKIKKKMNH